MAVDGDEGSSTPDLTTRAQEKQSSMTLARSSLIRKGIIYPPALGGHFRRPRDGGLHFTIQRSLTTTPTRDRSRTVSGVISAVAGRGPGSTFQLVVRFTSLEARPSAPADRIVSAQVRIQVGHRANTDQLLAACRAGSAQSTHNVMPVMVCDRRVPYLPPKIPALPREDELAEQRRRCHKAD